MKKIFLVLSFIMLFGQGIEGQAKQRKELLLQIGALQVYMDYARKGYNAASKGLNLMGDIKKGEVNLHGDYFKSLLRINPKIRNYYKIAEMISMQVEIMKIYKKTYADLKGNNLFHGDELDYIQRSFERLLENCSDRLDQLMMATTDSKLELGDDQRIGRIDALYQSMLEDYNFCLSFSGEAKLLSLSKSHEKKDLEWSGALYGL